MLTYADRRSAKSFYHLLRFLNGTGARPAEVHQAKARRIRSGTQAWVIDAIPQERGRYKKAYHGKPRVITIPNELLPLLHELNARYPEGPIFRTERGAPLDL